MPAPPPRIRGEKPPLPFGREKAGTWRFYVALPVVGNEGGIAHRVTTFARSSATHQTDPKHGSNSRERARRRNVCLLPVRMQVELLRVPVVLWLCEVPERQRDSRRVAGNFPKDRGDCSSFVPALLCGPFPTADLCVNKIPLLGTDRGQGEGRAQEEEVV